MSAGVFIEQRNGVIKYASFEALSKAVALFAKPAVAIVIGGPGISEVAKQCGQYGAGKIVVYEHEALSRYAASAYAKLVAKTVQEEGLSELFLSATAMGRDLAPRLSVRLNAGVAADCVEVSLSGETITAKRYTYSGKAIATVSLTTEKQIFTLRPNVFAALKIGGSVEPVVSAFNPETGDLKELVKEIVAAAGKLDVAEADIVVSGGRGLKEPGNFRLVEELAAVLGGAVGASRAVVDLGWRPHEEQVGQTGKVVSPKLYIAAGISGAVQHLAGMTSSKIIVAINKDKDAPIFQIADYGIVGDALEILPQLTSEFKKVLSN